MLDFHKWCSLNCIRCRSNYYFYSIPLVTQFSFSDVSWLTNIDKSLNSYHKNLYSISNLVHIRYRLVRFETSWFAFFKFLFVLHFNFCIRINQINISDYSKWNFISFRYNIRLNKNEFIFPIELNLLNNWLLKNVQWKRICVLCI